MDYFCYISQTKVDQLFQSAAPDEVDEWTERETRDRNLNAKASAGLSLGGIVNLFGGEIGYGAGVGREREWNARINYVEKLRVVLTSIAAERGQIPSLEDCVRTEEFPLYIHYKGQFRVTEPIEGPAPPIDQVVTLGSALNDVSLYLDCSLRFFSTANSEGQLFIHSGNYRFFGSPGRMPLTMDSVFLLQGRAAGEIYGSPLYLRLQAPDDVWGRTPEL